jgi:eukaryotic-like serine/threonine-protein kinase
MANGSSVNRTQTAKGAAGKANPFWRTDWFAAVLVILAVYFLNQFTDVFGTLERRYYDFASTTTARQPSDRVAIIAIDDASIANIGRWPWPRDVQARMTDVLAGAKVKVTVNTTLFFEPQTDRGLVYIQKIKDVLSDPAVVPGTSNEQLSKLISDAELALDTDTQLADSFSKAGNVLIASTFVIGQPQGKADKPLPDFALKSAIDATGDFAVAAARGQQPIALLGKAVAGVGHGNQLLDVDGAFRTEPLLINYFGKAVPSLSLLAVAKSLNLDASDITLVKGQSVQLGKLVIPTDTEAAMLPQFYNGTNGRPAFAVDSFHDVLTGKVPASKFADKIVIIGATAAGTSTQFSTPAGPGFSPAQTIAHTISSILSGHFIVKPVWGDAATLLIWLVVAAYLVAGLPRLSAGKAALVTAVMFAGLLITEFSLLSVKAKWLELVFPAAVLAIGYLAITTKRFLTTEAGKIKSDDESAETNRMMGLALQGQGQLDMAFDRFRRVPYTDALMENMNSLALDFERKRQFNKAQSVYEHMASFNAKYKDLQGRLSRIKNLSETVILGGGGKHAGATLLLGSMGVEKPMLGRYQVEKELGKGAMGVVYLGKDPKIGRIVAIKTLALSQEFEGEELDDARERFFREAETAGRLQHQHIVTIFDAGEEHDLAYIAMEFLKGKDLVEVTRAGQLLPVSKVLSIVARVAEALAYAHHQNVVHRDIKPANIMYDPESDSVKVTDFGIARITDSSRTKTGLILGTPSFMSAEQIAGKKIDGRSDLYSLGVMLYQMLTGSLPFKGDSMAELMFKIANEAAPDIRVARAGLSAELAAVVARSIGKLPADRYQDGNQFAAELRVLAVGVRDDDLVFTEAEATLVQHKKVGTHGDTISTLTVNNYSHRQTDHAARDIQQ